MNCQTCQAPLETGETICPNCGRFVDDRIESDIRRIAALSRRDPAGAKQLFFEAEKSLSRPDVNHFRARTSYFMGQREKAPPPPVRRARTAGAGRSQSPSTPVQRPPEAGAPSGGGEMREVRTAPRDVASAPSYRPAPPTGRGDRAIFMDFNQAPAEIVKVMADTERQAASFTDRRKGVRRILFFLFPLGLAFLILDWLLGYNRLTFTLVAAASWLWAIIGLRIIARRGRVPQFGPQFQAARRIFETLKDDVAPRQTLAGWLDLTGAEWPEKKTREKTALSGRPVSYYHDEWLRFKGRLYDGSVLRLSLAERRKVREGFWKRSRISGKRKYKPGSSASQHRLKVAISIAPGTHQIRPIDPRVPAIEGSRFAIQEVEAGAGRLVLSTAATQAFDGWDVLHVLRFCYDHLQPV